MLRSTSSASRRVLLLQRRAPSARAASSSTPTPPRPSTSSTPAGVKPASPATPAAVDAVTAAAKKNSITIPPPPGSIGSSSLASASKPPPPSGGSSIFPKLLLLGVLLAPAGAAVYLQQNPTWNPDVLRDNTNWIKFRELVLGKDTRPTSTPVQAPVKAPARTPEEYSRVITKGQADAPVPVTTKKKTDVVVSSSKAPSTDTKKKSSIAATVEQKTKEVVQAALAAEQQVEQQVEQTTRDVVNAAIDAARAVEEQAEATGRDVVHAVQATEKQVEQKGRDAIDAVKQTEQQVAKQTSDAVAIAKAAEQDAVASVEAAAADAKRLIEQQIDDATQRARDELDQLTNDASAATLSAKVDAKIHATTKELVDTLRAESDAAADDMDKNYLNNLHELDAHALVIRVAQLATEMKHRSKWEAARLLEALRVMEENAQKKSKEVLRQQDELHKELLAKELRFQQEVLTRKTRDETAELKKAYAHDLARNVNAQRTAILNKLQETFEREKKIIEDRYATQLRAKSNELQEILATERTQRIAEMENYRAQLRALNTVLEHSSTYEAFSHQIHKTSVAALALSDRIEAAAPLRDEIRALREAARSDELIEAALQTLPQHVIDNGAPSVSQLQERFNVVKKVAHRAALAPPNSSLMGQLFGSALSLLIIPPGGPIDGTDTDAVFSRADYALKAGDIENAVAELKMLSGTPADVSKDWIAAAESRLAVEQTAKVVKAHVALLAASCS